MSSETGCGCYGACAPSLTLDPHKRVHYAQGLVLGVDEFVQEEFYFLEGARRHHRTLHGYGTVCGLGVETRDTGSGVEVRVAPGHAIDTMGRELRVDTAQCALLDDWLARQSAGSPPLALPSPPEIEAWVVLCYRECLTDQEPIPGGPCRTPEESMTPTRVTESFSLRLDLQRPDMSGLDAIRAFARLIGRLRPVPGGAPDLSVAEFEAEVAALAPASPPVSPPSPASPPDAPIDIPEGLVETYLDAAFRTWVTVVRPALVPAGRGCADGPGGDGCIALARLTVPVSEAGGGLAVVGGAAAVAIEDAERPLLLSTQLLQELLINGGATGAGGGAQEHDQLLGLADDDHRQYLRIEPRDASPPAGPDILVNDLSGAGSFRLRGIPDAAAPGDVLPSGQPAAGDLSGRLPDPRVTGLQGLGVPQPGNADVGRHLSVAQAGGNLVWRLVDPPTGSGDPSGEEGLVRLLALSWMHNAPGDLLVTLRRGGGQARQVPGIAVAFGAKEVGDARVLLGIDRERERFDLGSLDIHSFRIYAEIDDDRLPSAATRLRLRPQALIPIAPRVEPGQSFFNEAAEIEETAAPGAMLLLDPETHAAVLRAGLLVWVEIDGDHVLGRGEDPDEPARAVDTEFLRSRLPSGDRPGGAERGTQGGPFSSWINRANREGPAGGPIDINRADLGVLRAIGVTAAAARRVIGARDRQRGFRSFDEIRDVPQLSAAARDLLTDARRVYIGPR